MEAKPEGGGTMVVNALFLGVLWLIYSFKEVVSISPSASFIYTTDTGMKALLMLLTTLVIFSIARLATNQAAASRQLADQLEALREQLKETREQNRLLSKLLDVSETSAARKGTQDTTP